MNTSLFTLLAALVLGSSSVAADATPAKATTKPVAAKPAPVESKPLRAADGLLLRVILTKLGVDDDKAFRVASDYLVKTDLAQPRESLAKLLTVHGVVTSPLTSVRSALTDIIFVMQELARLQAFEPDAIDPELVDDFRAIAKGAMTRDVFLAKWKPFLAPGAAASATTAQETHDAAAGVTKLDRPVDKRKAKGSAPVPKEVVSGGGNGSFRARLKEQEEERETAAAELAAAKAAAAAAEPKGDDASKDDTRDEDRRKRRGPKAPKKKN